MERGGRLHQVRELLADNQPIQLPIDNQVLNQLHRKLSLQRNWFYKGCAIDKYATINSGNLVCEEDFEWVLGEIVPSLIL